MKNWVAGLGIALMLSTPLIAQEGGGESSNRVNAETDWSVFVEDDPTQCWVVSAPRETVNTREGRVVAVRRSAILLFVSYWPSESRMGEVSFTGGYPFAEGSTVTLEIGNSTFELFVDGHAQRAACRR